MIWETNSKVIVDQPRPEHPYFQKAYDFMKLWLAGQQEFALQTSGSTGTPKLVQMTRRQLAGSAAVTGEMLELNEGTRALVCLNIVYVAGLMMLVRGMELGWELTIIEPSANPLLNLESRFDFVAMVPAQLTASIDEKSTNDKVNKLGKILLGGAPVSISLQTKIEALAVPVYQSYGMTETVSHVALRRLNGTERRSDYTLLPGVNFGLDERGCLYVSGPMTKGEIVQTNDLAEITSERSFQWLGRADNVINSGGVKIVLDTVDVHIEAALAEMGYNVSFFSWYQNDEKLGQKLILIMERNMENPDVSTLLSEIRKRVSTYETPKHVYFADRFVKTPTEKIDKRATAELLFKSING